jgi:hypothetical protein
MMKKNDMVLFDTIFVLCTVFVAVICFENSPILSTLQILGLILYFAAKLKSKIQS